MFKVQVKIDSKKKNSLFNRTEVNLTISEFEATPSRQDVAVALCKELDCKADALVIKKIHQPFGSKSVAVEALVYDSLEAVKQFERSYLRARGKAKGNAEAKAEPAPTVTEQPTPTAEAK